MSLLLLLSGLAAPGALDGQAAAATGAKASTVTLAVALTGKAAAATGVRAELAGTVPLTAKAAVATGVDAMLSASAAGESPSVPVLAFGPMPVR